RACCFSLNTFRLELFDLLFDLAEKIAHYFCRPGLAATSDPGIVLQHRFQGVAETVCSSFRVLAVFDHPCGGRVPEIVKRSILDAGFLSDLSERTADDL